MKRYIRKALEPLASLAEQERFIVDASKDEYLLAGELLDDALALVTAIENRYPWTQRLNETERQVVTTFGKVLRQEAGKLDVESLAAAELVYHCQPWANVREAAGQCLAALDGGSNHQAL